MTLFGSRKEAAKEQKEKMLVVNKNRCPQNHPCPSVKVCPVGALSQKRIQCSHSRSGQVHPLRKMCKILPYEGADTGIKKRRRTQNGDTNNYER